MMQLKNKQPSEKVELHIRNKHRGLYNFNQLINCCKELAPYVKLNAYNNESIDYFNPDAVKMLNKALLKYFYGIEHWDIPPNYLCPPIPGRADYIHYAADILADVNNSNIPTGNKITFLDIGVGANCVYPIIGNKEYGWHFIGSDIDAVSVASAKNIIDLNAGLKDAIEIRLQPNANSIFKGIIQSYELIDITICNPPFHASAADAKKATLKKLNNLKDKKIIKPILNFGGISNELWFTGGEEKFIQNIIIESKQFASSVFWFTTLVSKSAYLDKLQALLKNLNAVETKVVAMGQGNKISRLLAWTFLTKEQQLQWVKNK